MHTAIPAEELSVFDSLHSIHTVLDVGARDDVDYLMLKPGITLHAFEPNPVFYQQLRDNVRALQKKNNRRYKAILNNYALGAEEKTVFYNDGTQSLDGSLSWKGTSKTTVKVRTLDDYVIRHNIKRIDFLKMDVEGYELEVLRGGKHSLKLCRYIQFECYDDVTDGVIKGILNYEGFTFHYIGHRNMFCVKKGCKMPTFPKEIKEGGLIMKQPIC